MHAYAHACKGHGMHAYAHARCGHGMQVYSHGEARRGRYHVFTPRSSLLHGAPAFWLMLPWLP